MKKALIALFIFLAIFLVACSKAEVVVIDDTAVEEEVIEEGETLEKITGNGVLANKIAISCDDPDGDDEFTSGITSVEYDDGSTEDFVDMCPVRNEQFQIEYICEDGTAKSRTHICETFCVAGICFT